jgi:hypothetical protein
MPNPGMTPKEVYRAAHYAWRVDRNKAEACHYVSAVSGGIVRGCFRANRWFEATSKYFRGYDPVPRGSGFEGEPASADVWDRYVPTKMPNNALSQGQQQRLQ